MSIRINSYDKRLRRAVRLRSWFGRYDDEISEVQGHYDDLVAEARGKGLSGDEAAKYAEEFLGKPETVAGQVTRMSPGRLGVRLQWVALIAWNFFLITPLLLDLRGYVIGSAWGNFIEFWQSMSYAAVPLTATLFALAVFRAKRMSLLALGIGCLLVVALFLGRFMLFRGGVTGYSRMNAFMTADFNRMKALANQDLLPQMDRLKTLVNHPDDASVQLFSQQQTAKRGFGFNPVDKPMKAFWYPRGYRLLEYSTFPIVEFASTDDLHVATLKWQGADNLKAAMPQLEAKAHRSLAKLEEFHPERGAIAAATFDYTKAAWLRFAGYAVGTYALIAAATYLGRRRRTQLS